uniref:Iso2 n=1 Tax=Arundo donax TaxID=35708 RepID=A0A0A9EUC5_ARUDO
MIFVFERTGSNAMASRRGGRDRPSPPGPLTRKGALMKQNPSTWKSSTQCLRQSKISF